MRNALPLDLSGAFVDRIDHPTVERAIFGRITIAVQTGTEGCFWITADGTGYEDAVSPNDWTRMSEPGNRRAPENVFTCLRVPTVREILSFGYARSLRSAESGPAS